MPNKKSTLTASSKTLIGRLTSQLVSYDQAIKNTALRDQVLKLLEVHEGVNKLGIAIAVEAGLSSSSAKGRIKEYFLRYGGQIIEADELSAISGILDYGRRVRELRDEGMNIITGPACNPNTGKALRPDQYLFIH